MTQFERNLPPGHELLANSPATQSRGFKCTKALRTRHSSNPPNVEPPIFAAKHINSEKWVPLVEQDITKRTLDWAYLTFGPAHALPQP